MAKAEKAASDSASESAPDTTETATEQTPAPKAAVKEAKAPVPAHEPPSSGSSGKSKVLDRAAVIAGKIASASSQEGLIRGAHESTIALSAIRLAIALDRVAEVISDNPELVTMKITDAYDILEAKLKE